MRLDGETAAPTDAEFAIGTWVGWVRAGRAFGRLTANRDRLVVRAAFAKAVLERKHVKSVYVSRVLFRRSIAFHTDNGSGDWVFAFGFGIGQILNALEELGWPVVE